MISLSAAAGLTALVLAYALFKRFTRPSLSMIRGPKSPSFIFGNLLELYQRPAGEADFAWQRQYGKVVRFKSVFGEDQLMIMDPKALQKIFNAYSYPRPPTLRAIERMLNGNDLVWANGEDHRRQKSILLPGLGLSECKSFFPIFKDCAESICTKWTEIIAGNDGDRVVLNVLEWLSRGTLDGLGHAVFDVQFGTIQDDVHPLAKEYKNYFNDIFGLPSATQIFMQGALKYVPVRILDWMVDNGSSPRLVRARNVKAMVTSIAKELLQEKVDALSLGKSNMDIFSHLVKANMDATAKKRLSDEELYAQMRMLLISGHETTANTLAWILLELARNPKVQSRLRSEIRKAEATRGGSQLTFADLDSMPYLNAVIKEGLRFHSAVSNTTRIASQDDILPLSKPILTESGDLIDEVRIPKGTEIMISIAAYNRDKDIWGEDAHEFKPDRWLDGVMDNKLPVIGAYSNLLTFGGGIRGCIGWRFSLIETQAFISSLVGKFEFAMMDKAERIVRQSVIIMSPCVDGELDRGVQMPLTVSLAPQDD